MSLDEYWRQTVSDNLNFVTNVQKQSAIYRDSEKRRTIVFAAFGGSKFGNLASTEWVLQNKKKIENRLVAYINLDEIITSVETNQLESGKFLSIPEVKPEVVRKNYSKLLLQVALH